MAFSSSSSSSTGLLLHQLQQQHQQFSHGIWRRPAAARRSSSSSCPLQQQRQQQQPQHSSGVSSRKGLVCAAMGSTDHPKYVRVLDTTLRDGEQSPGVALSLHQKLRIAWQLAKLRVDVIDAGFPSASAREARAVREIAETVGRRGEEEEGGGGGGGGGHVPTICALSRCVRSDVEAAWQCVRHASKPRILTFISTSDIHLKHKLNKSAKEAIDMAVDAVAYARHLGCRDVQFGAEDAGRTPLEMLYEIFERVIEAGATTVGAGDTVGYLLPVEIEEMTRKIMANTRGMDHAVLSWHCHNDLGLATSNALAGAASGARQIELTINGIGERAGNSSLEEVVMAMKCRREMLDGLHTGIRTEHIFETSRMVAEYTGISVQRHKPIVGANAFAHESGIHQDGVLKNKSTYEILLPSDIGICVTDESRIILGKHSGRHALSSRLKQMGYNLEPAELNKLFSLFKDIAEEKKVVSNADLEALVAESTT